MSYVFLLFFVFVCFCFDSLVVLNHRYHPLLFLLFTFLQTLTPKNFWVLGLGWENKLKPNTQYPKMFIPKSNTHTQNQKNCIPKHNIHTKNPKNFIPKPNIHTQNPKIFWVNRLPSYQNIVNLFLIYIRNHFFFYSGQIIPFFFFLI